MKKKLHLIMASILCIASLFLLSASTSSCLPEESVGKATFDEVSAANSESAANIATNYGVPELSRSQDYENIKRRAEYLNQANTVGYIYLLTDTGALVREETVLGKVTSLNSYITPMEEIIRYDNVDVGDSWGTVFVTTQAPDIDGTYGENVDGIFWFTPDGVYREWTGLYLFSSERLSFTVDPILITSVG